MKKGISLIFEVKNYGVSRLVMYRDNVNDSYYVARYITEFDKNGCEVMLLDTKEFFVSFSSARRFFVYLLEHEPFVFNASL